MVENDCFYLFQEHISVSESWVLFIKAMFSV